MSAKVKTVQRANKDQGKCSSCGVALPPGSAYRYFRPGLRSRRKVVRCMKADCTPELEQSRLSDTFAAIEAAENDIESATTVEEVQNALDELASAISSVIDEYEGSIESAPMLEDQLRERIDQLSDFVTAIESASFDPEPDEPEAPQENDFLVYDQHPDVDQEAFDEAYEQYENDLEEWKEACQDALTEAKDVARDALSTAEF